MTQARAIQTQGHHDVCREALVHLMIGCEFKSPYLSELFDYLLEGNFDNWMWFQLKLASFQYSTRSRGGLLGKSQSFPLHYKPYFMEDLFEHIVHLQGREGLDDKEMSDQMNAANYARTLFFIGDYQRALKELLGSELQVEATIIAVSLVELNLLPTK